MHTLLSLSLELELSLGPAIGLEMSTETTADDVDTSSVSRDFDITKLVVNIIIIANTIRVVGITRALNRSNDDKVK